MVVTRRTLRAGGTATAGPASSTGGIKLSSTAGADVLMGASMNAAITAAAVSEAAPAIVADSILTTAAFVGAVGSIGAMGAAIGAAAAEVAVSTAVASVTEGAGPKLATTG